MRGHRDAVWSVAFSADGQLVATGGQDDGVRIWRCPVCGGIDEVRAMAVTTRTLTPRSAPLSSCRPADSGLFTAESGW